MACLTAKAQQNSQPPGADSLSLTLDSAESTFLRNNFQLISQRYNIDANQALVIQAKLWPNPNLSVDRGPLIPINDPTSQYPHSNFFSHSENAAQLSQLILLAGKRNKQIKLAEANVKLAQYQFFDLLRTLKYTLRSDFFHIYYLQQSAKVYDKEIKALQQIVDAYEKQTGKGYIAEKEVVLIKAQLYAFTSEYNDLVNQINDTESELRQILQAKPTTYITPEISTASVASLDPGKYPLAALLDSAHANRTDLLIAKANTDINKRNYDLQKALAVPDLTVSLGYDEQGSYAQNFNSVGASIDLPFFNRNQGNIKSAKAMIAVTDFTQKNVEVTVDETVTRALEKAFAQHNLYKKIDPTFESEFEKLTNEVIKNYMVRNIGLLDFLTFYDSYKQNALQLNNIQYNRVQALEDINFYTATNFFN
jgi:cobalt-zinc-cadmium efflux system outer membrane protein